MIKLYYHPSPNPAKIALFLEESGLPYELVPVDTRKGEQFSPAFVAINPNSKTPALTDGEVRVFDSTAILLYPRRKDRPIPFRKYPQGARRATLVAVRSLRAALARTQAKRCISSIFGSGGLGYAVDRYQFEARRHYSILDAQLAKGPYVLGESYTIADMSAWGWTRAVPFILGDSAFNALPHLKRWFDLINARPAATRADALKDKFSFKTEMDDDARRHMFRHVGRS